MRYIKIMVACLLFGALLYAPTGAEKEDPINGEKDGRVWVEGTRGWSEDGTNLWTAVTPLPAYNVGIGTSLPGYKLDVQGTGRFTGTLTIGSYTLPNTDGTSGYVLKTNGTGTVSWQPDANSGGTVSGSGTINYVPKWTGSTTLGDSPILTSGSNVGIGTSPSYPFHVVGSVSAGSGQSITGGVGYFMNTYGSGTDAPAVYGVFPTSWWGYGGFFTGGYAGVGGKNYTTGAFGALGWEQCGVYGDYAGPVGSSAGGFFESGTSNGSGYDASYCTHGVQGYSYGSINGYTYHFGVYGRAGGTPVRCGAVLGYHGGGFWGSLGYRTSSGTGYGGYFTSYGTGSGKSEYTGIGFGSYGNLMGGWVKGDVYGLSVKGERFALYTHGDEYTSGIRGTIINDYPKRQVAYSPISPAPDVYIHGISQINKGKGLIKFPAEFTRVISTEIPITVIVTPLGPSNGVYVQNITNSGFEVAENNNGKSDCQFSYIAIARRKGYERVSIPEELLSPEYEDNMDKVFYNENDTQNSGKPIWYDGHTPRFTKQPINPEVERNEREILENYLKKRIEHEKRRM